MSCCRKNNTSCFFFFYVTGVRRCRRISHFVELMVSASGWIRVPGFKADNGIGLCGTEQWMGM